MAVIVYPEEGWNSFNSVADADTFFSSVGATDWAALGDTEKEEYLIKSGHWLQAVSYGNYDSCDFAMGQLFLIGADITGGGEYLEQKDTSVPYTSATVGSISVSYNLASDGTVLTPPMVSTILDGCIKNTGAPRTRGFHVV